MKKFGVLFVVVLSVIVVFFSDSSAMAYSKLKMINHTGKTIYWVYFVPKHYTNWGSDRLSGVWNVGNSLTLATDKWRYWSLKICFDTKDDYVYWDGDNALDTDSIYQITIINNGKGGYKYLRNQ